MSTILVVDDMAMCREPIAEALRAHGHCVSCASGGTEALSMLRDQRPDLVLLDVTMPEPDGLTVLRIMRNNPDLKEISVILLTDRAEKDVVAHAIKCGVQGYLIKANFSLDVLLARVNACVRTPELATVGASTQASSSTQKTSLQSPNSTTATITPASSIKKSIDTTASPTTDAPVQIDRPTTSLHELEPIITKTQLAKLVKDGLNLKPLAATVHNVIAVTGNANCSANDVAKIVGNDQALSIRLLKLANSSAYSRGRPVDSIQSAVQRIGIHEVRQLVMALGVFDKYVDCKSTRIDIRLFWEHSLACGLIASALAKECQYKATDDCFLWGTLHDVGRVILLDHAPNEYNQVCKVADELELPLEVVELKLLFMDHCGILRNALEHWQFPPAFILPVVNHHKTIQQIERLAPEQTHPAMIVALANRLAHALMLGCSGNEMIYPFDDLMKALGISNKTIEKIVESIPEETRDLKITMLAHSTSGSWPEFGNLVRARFDIPVHPLCVSSEPSTDAIKLFLDVVCQIEDTEPPNIGVIYLRDAKEATTVYENFQSREAEADCGTLPLIIVCTKPEDNLEQPPWQTRPHVLLETPVPIALFVKTVHSLLGQPVES